MLAVNVKGGTGAGRRRIKPLPEWTCRCDVKQHAYSCPDCGQRRP